MFISLPATTKNENRITLKKLKKKRKKNYRNIFLSSESSKESFSYLQSRSEDKNSLRSKKKTVLNENSANFSFEQMIM